MNVLSLLAKAKYIPAVLWIVLLIAFIFGQFASLEVSSSIGSGNHGLVIDTGLVQYFYSRPQAQLEPFAINWLIYEENDPRPPYFGRFAYWPAGLPHHWWHGPYWRVLIQVPIPLLLTALLPFAVGPFIRFQFPLWQWFAFIATVAAELAFYLKW
jgi:hypothetical protein